MKKIPLTQGKFVLVDDEDYKRIIDMGRWCFDTGYAQKKISGKNILMHRIIIDVPSNLEVDHINGDKLDNRKCNLRSVTKSQNGMNRGVPVNNKSGYKGVSWFKLCKKWRAYITVGQKQISLGYFDSKEKAARAYNKASTKYHGNFCYQNIII